MSRVTSYYVVDADDDMLQLYNEQNSGAYLYNMGRPECKPGWKVPGIGDDGVGGKEPVAGCKDCGRD